LATRHQVRETVISFLYAKDIGNSDIVKFQDEILEDKKIRNSQKDFAIKLYNGILNKIDDIDKAINIHLKEWELNKIGTIERAILRLGTYEILYSHIDSAVVINEAIELAKELGSETSPKFINGVLDAVKKNVK
jgi:N utilization substance protein B